MAEERFSIVPEWVLDSDIGDCALRLYAMLLRYSNITGARMPARSTLATRLHKKSTDTVDRGLTELVALGAVQIEPRGPAGSGSRTDTGSARRDLPGTAPPPPRRRGPVRGVWPHRCGYPRGG
ncbi:MAG: helix-turn-helix domain-containing protein [Actinomycetota bacterium]|nr:helix-turn-helix domain-containing protein [Actinomycetota bacterium]